MKVAAKDIKPGMIFEHVKNMTCRYYTPFPNHRIRYTNFMTAKPDGSDLEILEAPRKYIVGNGYNGEYSSGYTGVMVRFKPVDNDVEFLSFWTDFKKATKLKE